jgi:hypothetical protein
MKKEKKIIIMNGRFSPSCYSRVYNHSWHIYIGAYSKADAARILGTALQDTRSQIAEINVYFSKGCWGNSMEGILVQRGAWMTKDYNDKPIRIVDESGNLIKENYPK